MSKSDNVHSPAHYTKYDLECIDVMKIRFGEEKVRIWAELNAFKYGWRRGEKDAEEQEVRKQIWCLRRSIGDDPRED